MSIDDCFSERKLRRVAPDPLRAEKSLATARDMAREAEQLAQAGFARMALVSAYAAMFHAARAILFRDGVVEKSHYCLALYVRKNYCETGKLAPKYATVLDGLREERHEVMYGFSTGRASAADAASAVEAANEFIAAVSGILHR